MDKILISACLLGDNTKYDGGNNDTPELRELLRFYDLVPFCPEMEGGLGVPRKPAEVRGTVVRNEKGKDVTPRFELGASKAAQLCAFLDIKMAILKERSPSCGVHQIHNGSFDGTIIPGQGITTRYLQKAGIRVMNEEEGIAFLKSCIESEEKGKIAKEAAQAREAEMKAKSEKAEDLEEKESEIKESPYKRQRPKFHEGQKRGEYGKENRYKGGKSSETHSGKKGYGSRDGHGYSKDRKRFNGKGTKSDFRKGSKGNYRKSQKPRED